MDLPREIHATLAHLPDLQARPIVFWGAGSMAQEALKIAETLGAEIPAFIDGNETRSGQSLSGRLIFGPDELPRFTAAGARIIIASTWWREIGMDLINRGFVPGRDFLPVQRRISNFGWDADLTEEIPTYIGRHTTQAAELLLYYPNVRVLHIGAFCSIAVGARVAANHPLSGISTNLAFNYRSRRIVEQDHPEPVLACNPPVRIGNDVWIGRNATLMPGIAVGDGAVIGANATVTRDVPPYAIVVGTPAQTLRFRFDPDKIQLLQTSRWWTWSDAKLRRHTAEMQNPDRFFALIQSRDTPNSLPT